MNRVQRLAKLEQKAGVQNDSEPDLSPYIEWIPRNLNIRTKDGRLVLIEYNPIQIRLNEIFDVLKAQHGQVHIITLKARQHGVSTWAQSRIFERCARTENQQALVLAHDKEGSDWLFGMSRLFKDTMQGCPPTDYSSKKEIVFSAPLRSSISVQVAHEFAGSARTVQFLHISELAKWKDPSTTMLSLMQAAAYADTIIESTANGQMGQGEYFFKMWEAAKEGNNEYMPVFFGWFDNPGYAISEHDPRFESLLAEPLEDEECALQESHRLTPGQMAWRRWAIRNLCGNDVDAFRQEYPATDTESFLKVEGTRIFDMGRCRIALTKAREPEAVGRLVWTLPPVLQSSGIAQNKEYLRVKFVPDENGPLSVWAFPPSESAEYTGYRFFCGADVALGVEGGDHSSAAVLDRRTRHIVATMHERIDPTVWGEHLAMLGVWYLRKLLIAPEVNSMGNATLSKLMSLYSNVWVSHKFAPGVPWLDSEAGKYGVWTGGNKEFMVQYLVDAIRESLWTDPDAAFWSEALNTVRDARGLASTRGKDRVACRFILATIDRLGPAAEYPKIPVKQATDYQIRAGDLERRHPDNGSRIDHRTHGIVTPAKYDWRIVGLRGGVTDDE